MRNYFMIAVLMMVTILSASTGNVSSQALNSAFRVSSKSNNSLTLSFQLPSYEFATEQLDGKSYSRIKLADSGFTRDIGMPELPVLSTMIAIPATLATPVASIMHNGTSLVLQWNEVPSANLYKVFRSDSPYGPFTLVGSTASNQYSVAAGNMGFYCIQAFQNNPSKQQ